MIALKETMSGEFEQSEKGLQFDLFLLHLTLLGSWDSSTIYFINKFYVAKYLAFTSRPTLSVSSKN